MNIVYLNGLFLPQDQAKVSVMDRGFLFGDGVYEVIPAFDGTFFGFEDHLQRLDTSLAAIAMKNPLSHDEWKKVLTQLLQKNNQTTGKVSCYCQVTRGADKTRSHTFPDNLKPTVVAFITAPKTFSLEKARQGFNAITLDDTRRKNCHIKAITLLPSILQIQEAKSKGAIEAILIRNNEVLECASSNVFIVKNGELLTPPLSNNILSGVTRGIIIELARAHNIAITETSITPDMLFHADEVWVTGSTKEICPIVMLDDKPVNDGKVGPVWLRMVQYYQEYKQHTQQKQLKEKEMNNDQ